MPARKEGNTPANPTAVERASDRELVVKRSFNAPARVVFEAWTTPDLFIRWWVPKSFGMTILGFEMDVRVGGTYRVVIRHPAASEPMTFFGTYKEVKPHSRLMWTNEESADAAMTTVTFEERDGKTLVVMRDLYPSKDALDAAIASGATSSTDEMFGQLDELLAGPRAAA